jgi:hypothetical protein
MKPVIQPEPETKEDLFGLLHSLLGEAVRTVRDLPAILPEEQSAKERLKYLLNQANEITVRFSPIYGGLYGRHNHQ